MTRVEDNIRASRGGMKLPREMKIKIICVSIGSWNILARRDILATWNNVNRSKI